MHPTIIALLGLLTSTAGLHLSMSFGPSDIAGVLIPIGMVIVLGAGFVAARSR